ncbi:MAG TPA: DUF5946 family protein [Cytophagaceae bacterium]|jgi:hypothetical protein
MHQTESRKDCICFSCKAIVPDIEGGVHKYMDSSPGCWYLFGKLLEKEFSDSSYRVNSRLTTDSYAIQHYGKASVPQAVKSVNHHLISLCFYFDFKMTAKQSDVAFKSLAHLKSRFNWMQPPKNIGNMTLVDVLKAKTSEEHLILVEQWAYESWMAWEQHHLAIRNFIKSHYQF